MPSSLSRQLVNAVNPRLALYTRAGLLAFIILVLNYAAIAVIALLFTRQCSMITNTETTYPSTEAPASLNGKHVRFIRDTFAQEQVTTSGGITRTVSVEMCATEASHLVTAPFPLATYLGAPASLGGVGLPATSITAYSGTNIAFELPCWNTFFPCDGPGYSSTFDGDIPGWFQNPNRETMPCRTQAMMDAAEAELGAALYDKEAMRRQVWCSKADRDRSIDAYWSVRDMQSELHPGQTVSLALTCGETWWMAPGGVRTTELFTGASENIPNQGYIGSVMPTYKLHWNVTKTVVTETCLTFPQAFGLAFGYAAQIEILITLVLLFVFKGVGIVKDAEHVVDLSSGIVDTVTAKKVAKVAKGPEA